MVTEWECRGLISCMISQKVGRICGISVWLLGRPDNRRKKTRRRLKESSRMSQVIKRRNQNRSVRVTDCRPRGRFRWLRIHGAVLRFSGTRVGIASASYPKRRRARDSSTFAARRDVARPSKINLRICNTYGRNVTPQAIQVRRLQSAGQPTSLLWRSLGTQIILILNWL